MLPPIRALVVFLSLALAVSASAATDAEFQAARQKLHEAAPQKNRAQLQAVADEVDQLARKLPNRPEVASALNASAGTVRKAGGSITVSLFLATASIDLASAGNYLDENLELFQALIDAYKLSRLFNAQLDAAQEWMRRAEAKGQSHFFVRASLLAVEALWSLDRLDEGLALSESTVKHARSLGQHRIAALLLLRTAATYQRVGERNKHLNYLQQALTSARLSTDTATLAEIAARLGYERELDQAPDAAELINEAITAAGRPDRSINRAAAIAHVAAYHLHRSEFDLAEAYARDALDRTGRSGTRSTHLAASTTLASALLARGDRAGAIAVARESMNKVSDELLGQPDLLNFDERQSLVTITRLLADLHEQEGNFQEAFRFQGLNAQIKAIDTEARHKLLIAQVSYRAETAASEEKINNLEQSRQFQALELEKERLALINERNRTKALEKIEQARELELASTRRMNVAYAVIALLAIGLLGVNLYAVWVQRRSAKLLRRQNEQLHQLNAEKDEFLAIAAHDLKSPLGGIQRACEIIADRQTDSDFARELARDMAQSASRMFHLVTRLLDLRRVGQPAEPLSPCNVTELARSIQTEAQPKARAKQITLELIAPPEPVRALGDPVRISQILDNLLSNALKFSPAGKRVTVTVMEDTAGPSLAVADEGPGISTEEQEKLFQKFTQLSARPTAGEHSSGLGLAIVLAQVEALGGRIACESEPGHGTRFVVRLQPVATETSTPQRVAA